MIANEERSDGIYVLTVILVILGLCVSHYLLLPKPIAGIPYHPSAARSILGDLPALFREGSDAGLAWLVFVASRQPDPLFQVFLNPLGKPFVVLTDYHEARDIMMRRKEWDRSSFATNVVKGALPNHHITLPTGPAWKAQRRLLQDLMMPEFLNKVAAPNIYTSVTSLLSLWEKKAVIADGRAFSSQRDIYHAAMDAVLDFSFGKSFSHRTMPGQINAVESLGALSSSGEPLEFTPAPVHETIKAILQTAETIGEVKDTGLVGLAWWWKKLQSETIEAHRTRVTFLKDQVGRARERIRCVRSSNDTAIQSALDLILYREARCAEKEAREPVFWSDVIRDEILGFAMAGHDTTSTTILWTLKFLTNSQDAQAKLRDALHRAHPNPLAEKRLPNHSEITSTHCAYLEAVIEEALRLAHVFPLIERQCSEDTVLLGRYIPKGTILLIGTKGPSITENARIIDENIRSESSRAAALKRGYRAWDEKSDIGAFNPERWLKRKRGSDAWEFDSLAGPTLPFGLGLRSCFGKKLGYLELRLLVTLLVWNFDFQPVPSDLSGLEPYEGLTHRPKHCYVKLVKRSNS
ncbi:unnamed protein product [Clonostachys byssicola]|uniref:Cytochrome P450 n=1 Tax=Clonostachys byssicola TaxID=160290 RepID=A0A9N9U7D4_9HYPO|nr:unnamed protein product [Clonostachys byssicola]